MWILSQFAQAEYCSSFHFPYVRSSVHRRDISHLSNVYMAYGIYAIWMIRRPMKSYIFRYISRTHHSRLNQTRPYYQETTLITLITLSNMTNLTILTDQKNYQDDKCRIHIDYFVLFEKRDKLEAKLNIRELKKIEQALNLRKWCFERFALPQEKSRINGNCVDGSCQRGN